MASLNADYNSPSEQPPPSSRWNNVKGNLKSRTGIAGLVLLCVIIVAVLGICLWQFLPNEAPVALALDFYPRPPPDRKERDLIWYKGSDQSSYQVFVDSLNKLVDVYKVPDKPAEKETIVNCDYDSPAPKNKSCFFNIRGLDTCIAENKYNYQRSRPCVFIKLNGIPNWTPEFYNDTKALPETMPLYLRHYIENIKQSDPRKLNTIWISCDGDSPVDIENVGPISYHPMSGFPGYYFPYNSDEGYNIPLVAVGFERPRLGVLINIECKAWARNLDFYKGEGRVHIRLLID